MAVPNVSEGRDLETLEALERSLGPARFLDLHTDPDHHRAVFTLAARQGELAEGLVRLAREAVKRIDVSSHTGIHPHIGALDVMPVVYLDEERRGAAAAEILTAGARVGDELGVPVFLYGELATRREHIERAWIRRGAAAARGIQRLPRDQRSRDGALDRRRPARVRRRAARSEGARPVPRGPPARAGVDQRARPPRHPAARGRGVR